MAPSIVLDTNVLIAALRSNSGASFELLSRVGGEEFLIDLSVPLVLEYEAVAKRDARAFGLTHSDIDDIVDYLCAVGQHHRIHFLWRPVLRDAQDDMVLELAVEAASDCIVTHNVRDFEGAARFGVRVLPPAAFLKQIGVAR